MQMIRSIQELKQIQLEMAASKQEEKKWWQFWK
ncbi:DUF3967 domain-containing protein [Rossellomorea sp. GAMAL-10_SWC]